MCRYSPLALHQVHDQLSAMWEQHCIKGAILRSNLNAIAEFPVTYAHVTRELDHYAPTLSQLLIERGCGPRVAAEDGEDEQTSGDEPPSFAWKNVLPLLPLASRRRKIPLLTRDTGDSVDEKKSKVLERKRRREEEEEPAAAATASSSETFAPSSVSE